MNSNRDMSRRAFLQASMGLGGLALWPGIGGAKIGAKGLHHPARAKSVIYINLVGGSSQIDLFDPKPELRKRDGEKCPEELFEGKRLAFIRSRPKLMGSPYEFSRHGQSGTEVSSLLPHFAEIVDDVALIRSMHCDEFNHTPAQLQLLTGIGRFGRPSLGAWVDYGISTENENLPAFVALLSTSLLPAVGSAGWGAGMLPSHHQGVQFRSKGEPVLYLGSPPGVSRETQGKDIAAIRKLNELRFEQERDPEIQTRNAQYDLAWRMQSEIPEAVNLEAEPMSVRQAYNAVPGSGNFGSQCLLARRLVEHGVRFVQIFDEGWDHHGSIFKFLPGKAKSVDQGMAALVKDLKERGMLDETLVVCATEFGRTPILQASDTSGKTGDPGRDHQRDAFTIWLAGAGIRPGITFGRTDELGHKVVEDPVHVHDLNATLLHLLGIDHERLVFRHQGRDYRLTDVHGTVVRGILT